jgi:hypothetical protein
MDYGPPDPKPTHWPGQIHRDRAMADVRDVALQASAPGTIARTLEIARSFIGYNGGGTTDNPATLFGVWSHYDGSLGDQNAQWCSMFCNYVLSHAGVLPLLPDPGWAGLHVGSISVSGMWNAYPTPMSKYHNDTPGPGDLVCFNFNDRSGNINGTPDHTGIVESYDPNTRLITSIQGNTIGQVGGYSRMGNTCRRKVHNNDFVVGYCVPKYVSAPAPDNPIPDPGPSPIPTGVSSMPTVILSKDKDNSRGAAFLLPDGTRSHGMSREVWTAINHVAREGGASIVNIPHGDYDAFPLAKPPTPPAPLAPVA